jgi:hypothetical protein
MDAHTDKFKKNSTLCKHVPCNTLTHSTNEEIRYDANITKCFVPEYQCRGGHVC